MTKKAIFILPQIGFNEHELFTVKKVFEKNKIKCIIASYSIGTVIGKNEKTINATEVIGKIDPKDYSIVVLVGGMNVSSLYEYPQFIEFVQGMNDSGGILGLMCMASALLSAKSEILTGKKVTVFCSKNKWSIEEVIKNNSSYVDSDIVVDGNIVSCRNEENALEFGKRIVEILK